MLSCTINVFMPPATGCSYDRHMEAIIAGMECHFLLPSLLLTVLDMRLL